MTGSRETDRLDDDIDRAWHVLDEARQSGRLNPRRAVPERMRAAEEMTQIINRLAQAVAETRSLARTIRVASHRPGGVEPGVSRAVAGAAGACGRGHRERDADGLRPARAELTQLSDRLATEQLHGGLWPMFGALLVNLRNVLDALDVVAEAQPVRVPAPALASSSGG